MFEHMDSRTRLASTLTWAIWCALANLMIAQPAPARAQQNSGTAALFQSIDDLRHVQRPIDPEVVRSRTVTVDMTPLGGIAMAQGRAVLLNLFDDVSYEAVLERPVRVSAASSGWVGPLSGIQHGTFALVVADGVLAANVYAHEQGVFQIRFVEDGIYAINQVDPSAYPPCGNGPKQHFEGTAQNTPLDWNTSDPDFGATTSDASVAGSDTLEIDVLVVYTALARAAAGGTAAMNALVNLGAVETNDAYYNSGVHQHIDLVYVGEVDYEETGFISEGLNHLTNKRDGLLDEVHDLRGIYGADLVDLIIRDTSYCGLAWTLILPGLPVWYSYGFSVVKVDCVAGPQWSFAHELAHNMGCFHDRENVSPDAPEPVDPWAYGYRFWGDSGTQWRTIMAYEPGTRIKQFSNPYATYDGQPTGIYEGREGEANNARTINRTLTTIRDLREIVSDIKWVQFGYAGLEFGTFVNPYNTLTEGVTTIPAGGTVAVKSGTSSSAYLIDKAMILRAYDGSVTLGR